MRNYLLILLSSLVMQELAAQNPAIDSIRLEINAAKTDSARIERSLDLAWAFYRQAMDDSATVYVRFVIEKSQAIAWPNPEIGATQLLAFINQATEDYGEAIRFFRRSFDLSKRAGAPLDVFYHYIGMANCYALKGEIDTATMLFDSARIALDTTNYPHVKYFHQSLVFLYSQEEQYEQAMVHSRQLIANGQKKKDTLAILEGYYNLAADLEELNFHDSAIFYLSLALPIAKKSGNRFMEWQIKACTGICQIEKGDYAAGAKSLLEAEPIGAEFGEELCCGNGAYLAKALYHLGRYQEAERYIEKAEQQLPTIAFLREKRNVLLALVDIYEAQKNYEKAYTTLQELRIVQDTLVSQEYHKDLAELEVRHQTREQQKELIRQDEKLDQQRLLILMALLAIALLSLLAWFYRRNSRNRRKVGKLLEARNEELQALDQIKSQFFANISHEFRTPLTLILGPIEEVLSQIKDRTLRQPLETARQSSRQLLSLVEELLDLSRLEAGKVGLHPVQITLDPWLRQHFFAFESAAKVRNIDLKYINNLAPLAATQIDADKLAKMLNNLIGNALKYSSSGTSITFTTRFLPENDDKGNFVCEVMDEGPGIHPDDQPHIFERFYQGKKTVGGAGIGLALSRELAHIMGGTLTMESNLDNKGSTFILSLPIVLSEVRTIEIPTNQKVATTIKPTPKLSLTSDQEQPAILIVEDHPEMRDFLTQILDKDFKTTTAHHGQAALNLLEKKSFDIVLSDAMMPELDGFELLSAIRSRPTVFRDIPFVMLTALALTEEKLRAFQLGVDDYLVKPFQTAELIARIRSLLHNKTQRAQWVDKQTQKPPEPVDQQLLRQAQLVVMKNLTEPDFRIADLAKTLAQSQRTLERMLKSITGFTPVGFIKEIRLQEAYRLLKGQSFRTVSEVAQAVGINNFSYFSRSFTERFGINPTELLRGQDIPAK